MSLLGSHPGRTNPPITLAPLHQEVRCFVHSCAHSTTRSAAHSFQLLVSLAYFLLGWRPLPVGESCLQMMNFERRNFWPQLPPSRRPLDQWPALWKGLCRESHDPAQRPTWPFSQNLDLASSSCFTILMNCSDSRCFPGPLHRNGEVHSHVSPTRFNYYYRQCHYIFAGPWWIGVWRQLRHQTAASAQNSHRSATCFFACSWLDLAKPPLLHFRRPGVLTFYTPGVCLHENREPFEATWIPLFVGFAEWFFSLLRLLRKPDPPFGWALTLRLRSSSLHRWQPPCFPLCYRRCALRTFWSAFLAPREYMFLLSLVWATVRYVLYYEIYMIYSEMITND